MVWRLTFPVWLFALAVAVPAGAQAPPRLELPVACEIGVICVVQNYVDQDPGPGARDHACGPLSYDGHGGTDIRVPGRPEMTAGVAVLAAAPGWPAPEAVVKLLEEVAAGDADPGTRLDAKQALTEMKRMRSPDAGD